MSALSVPMPFFENGVGVHFPDNNTFRLSDCQAHLAIKGKGVTEMDIGWLDAASDTLWLVELKAFHDASNPLYRSKNLANPQIAEGIIAHLMTKSIHTLCQIATDRAGTKSCLVPLTIRQSTHIKLVHLLKTMPGQASLLPAVQDKLRRELQPYLTIFNVGAVTVIDYEEAKKTGLLSWIA